MAKEEKEVQVVKTPEELEREELDAIIEKVRAAQKIYSTYTQEQVDNIFRAAALAANEERIPLAKMAVEESGMGVVEDKVIKTTLPLNTSTINIKTKKPAALSNPTTLSVLSKSQNRSALSPVSFLPLTRLQPLYSNHSWR